MTYRTIIAVLVGVILASFAVTASASAAVGTWTSSSSDNIVVSLTYEGGSGSYDAGQFNPPDCSAVPCSVTGRVIANHTGKTITSTEWFKDLSDTQRFAGSGADWAATWSYPSTGRYNPGAIVHFSDGSRGGAGIGELTVYNGAIPAPTVSCTCHSPLVPQDATRNTFVINATNATNVSVLFTDTNGRALEPTVVRRWSDSTGYHVEYRVTALPNGEYYVSYAVSNDRAGAEGMYQGTVVNSGPPPPDFWNLALSQFRKKQHSVCTYGTKLQVSARQSGSARVRLALQGRLPHSRWRTLVRRSTTKTFSAGRVRASAAIKFGTKRGPAANYAGRHARFRLVSGPDALTSSSAKKTVAIKRRSLSAGRVLACQL